MLAHLAACILAAQPAPTAAAPPEPPAITEGAWRAWLITPGGRLDFGLTISHRADAINAELWNSGERIPVEHVTFDGSHLTLDFPHYDSQIVARVTDNGASLRGVWTKQRGPGKTAEVQFRAEGPRTADGYESNDPGAPFPSGFLGSQRDGGDLLLRYTVDFKDDDAPAIAEIRLPGGFTHAHATFLTTTGDYRYLGGSLKDRNRFQLSCFDGSHAFLFDIKVNDDRSIAGDFWSGDWYHTTFTGVLNFDAALPDAFSLTQPLAGANIDRLAFRDLEGNPAPLADARFGAGSPRVVLLTGSWCPNCNDAMPFLVELHKEFSPRGVAFLALSFEISGDDTRDARQVRLAAQRHHIPFPMLLAGVSDKKKASEALPVLDQVRAFPTTLFVNADGTIRSVYQGFSGPATGDAHTRLQADFRRAIDALINPD